MHWCKNWFSASTNCPTQAQSKPTVKVMVHPPHLLPHHCFPPPDSPTGFTPTPGSSPSLSPPFWIPRWRRNPRPPRSRSRTPAPHLPQRPTPSPDSGPWSGYHPGVRTPSFTSYPATPRTASYLGSPSTWWSPVAPPPTRSFPTPQPAFPHRDGLHPCFTPPHHSHTSISIQLPPLLLLPLAPQWTCGCGDIHVCMHKQQHVSLVQPSPLTARLQDYKTIHYS
jgi:hypothetical protein